MKAAPFYEHGPASAIRYGEVPDPSPGKNGVVIDVEYCGVNHLDIWTRMGVAGKKIRLPHVCGCDIVGTVRKGASFQPGEPVMVYPGISCGKCPHCRQGRENLCSQFAIIGGMSDHDGGYAEQVTVPARNVIALKLDAKTAATLAVSYLTAWNMLKANGAGKGKSLLVYGAASGVGMATIQLARALGVSTIITTAAGRDKVQFGNRLGADIVIDRSKVKDIAGEVMKITGTGADIAIDHVGAATWQTSIASVRTGGRMGVCGMTSGNDAVVPVRTFYSKQVTMTGALLGSKAQLMELLKFVKAKKIRPVVDSVFPLKEARAAQERMERGLHAGKILLKCS
ncbi:MAG: zinc-binding dehydrogenase [Nitrososphaera sp.]|uniref:zinc-binding dehydrogenase n=1 Tax=Nitrososphaera sp. TaxID=1971748 RepID=UPI003D6F9155